MRIVRLLDETDWQSRVPAIEQIFFATSRSGQALQGRQRDAFKERWLGRYLAHHLQHFHVAIDDDEAVAGYLAGCLDNPARHPRFADIGYYASFATWCDLYPCHLHVNLDERHRNRGVGSALVDAFAVQATASGVQGLHVVTAAQARNVRFYERNDFRALSKARWDDAEVVFMGRALRVS